VFAGDRFGEVDARFTHCAILALSLLGRVHDSGTSILMACPCVADLHVGVNVDKVAEYTLSCQNFDGGFGAVVGAESHAAMGTYVAFRHTTLTDCGPVWTCVGTLAALGRLDALGERGAETLAAWLAERQTPAGGLNGRPEKMADVCYSFWAAGALAILRRLHWIDARALERFILGAQDDDGGGIADRAGDMPDVFHTVFGAAGLCAWLNCRRWPDYAIGLSLLGYPHLSDVDPVYCMPAALIERMGLRTEWKALPRRKVFI
jgi:geranylgeranyl transferase type-2 subunit beta